MVIEQEQDKGWLGNHLSDLKQFLFGCGEWISPEEVTNHAYLRGQNLLPLEAARYTAESFRFQAGFKGPLPGYHAGDIRIADLPEDINKQPFTTYFENVPGEEGKLYHFFALEPYRHDLQGLANALLIPADGSRDVVYMLKPSGITGVSAVTSKVRASNLQIDWNNNHPVEHRPFTRVINGVPRLFWLTTVVTRKKSDEFQSTTSGAPLIVLTDGKSNITVPVDSLHPETWTDKLVKELGRLQ
jgi:hypothetical protein